MDRKKSMELWETLKIRARRDAARRGHDLGPFVTTVATELGLKIKRGKSACKTCGAEVQITRHPQMDSTIGPALEHDCSEVIGWHKEISEQYPLAHKFLFCLRINGYRWYTRPDFQSWLRTYRDAGRRPIATWFNGIFDSSSDVFLTYDYEDGSDAQDLPADIWQEIIAMIADGRHRRDFGVIWITNLLPDDEYPETE